MIIILASRWDQTSRAVASRWAPLDVRILTARDLSIVGWRQQQSAPDGDTAVAERKLVPHEKITGVLTLLPCVFEEELTEIVPEDRGYVASEMTAFLLFWLSRLRCPVLNRPTPACLSGPYWRREKWVRIAAQAGIPVEPVHRHSSPPDCPSEEGALPLSTTMTVIGDRVFGEGEPALQGYALHLARLAQVELLAVRFSGPERGAYFVRADVLPDLSHAGMADAVLELIRSGQKGWA
ncbi:MAG: hypothetical protein JO015_21685 [Verrucomicrobia bacterium]|nr:hypothetical protein [Verrucomicrobiota bacterium]